MIKRKKVKSTNWIVSVLFFLLGVSMLLCLEFNLDFSGMVELEGLGPTVVTFLILYVYAGILMWVGAFILIDEFNHSKHPEKYNYCKRCKRIILVEKGKFCNHCTYSIERSLENNNEKYFKDYKENYKERYLKLKTRMKKK